MINIREIYKILPENLDAFNDYFNFDLYPFMIKNGAKLIGRWVNGDKDEILAIWEYKGIEHYEGIINLIKNSELKKTDKMFYIESNQDFISSTAPYPASYHLHKHLMSVSGFITNTDGEVLLVRNFHRSDTMEMPGGQVEEGETLEQAIHREIFEETGIEINLLGVTGIYQNVTSGVTCVVFRGEYRSGDIRTAENETSEVFFTPLNKENINQFITRTQFRSRALDAMDANYIPYEAFKARPYELVKRFEVKKEYS